MVGSSWLSILSLRLMVEPIYQLRNSKVPPLYQSALNYFGEFESVYEERYQKRFGILRDVVREVVYKYLDSGDLRNGFARIKCKGCNNEVLLGFSCKGRYFCPSCHQKRVLMFGEWINYLLSTLLTFHINPQGPAKARHSYAW